MTDRNAAIKAMQDLGDKVAVTAFLNPLMIAHSAKEFVSGLNVKENRRLARAILQQLARELEKGD